MAARYAGVDDGQTCLVEEASMWADRSNPEGVLEGPMGTGAEFGRRPRVVLADGARLGLDEMGDEG